MKRFSQDELPSYLWHFICFWFSSATPYPLNKTDSKGYDVATRRVGPSDLAATVFQHLGIDLNSHWTNAQGRPIPNTPPRKPAPWSIPSCSLTN